MQHQRYRDTMRLAQELGADLMAETARAAVDRDHALALLQPIGIGSRCWSPTADADIRTWEKYSHDAVFALVSVAVLGRLSIEG